MNTYLLASSLDISSICTNADNCLSWLIILFDIFAIFYLVFVSFYKVTKLVRMIGWIWLGILVTVDIVVVAVHPCILTLLCVLFTITILAAILSVVLPNFGSLGERQGDDQSNSKAKCGSYVVRAIGENKFCFELYDKQNKFLVRSYDCYESELDVKEAIEITRNNGKVAEVEDRTVNWIKEANLPKFEIFAENNLYFYKLSSDDNKLLLKSVGFADVKNCRKQINKTVAAVKSLDTYISIEKLSETDAQQYKDMKPISFTKPKKEADKE